MSEDTIETVRVCRECGEEYRPDVLVCADCGGELETRRADEPLARPAPEPPPTTELEGYRPVYTGSRAMDLVPLCDRLREAAIETSGSSSSPRASRADRRATCSWSRTAKPRRRSSPSPS